MSWAIVCAWASITWILLTLIAMIDGGRTATYVISSLEGITAVGGCAAILTCLFYILEVKENE